MKLHQGQHCLGAGQWSPPCRFILLLYLNKLIVERNLHLSLNSVLDRCQNILVNNNTITTNKNNNNNNDDDGDDNNN